MSMDVSFVQVWQELYQPAHMVTGGPALDGAGRIDGSRWKAPVRHLVVLQSHSDLCQVVFAPGAACGFPGLLHRWEQQ